MLWIWYTIKSHKLYAILYEDMLAKTLLTRFFGVCFVEDVALCLSTSKHNGKSGTGYIPQQSKTWKYTRIKKCHRVLFKPVILIYNMWGIMMMLYVRYI
jgi:hypothetical protein